MALATVRSTASATAATAPSCEDDAGCIINEELTPEEVRDRHLRRLPVTVLPKGLRSDALFAPSTSTKDSLDED